jgi:uncharacterized SAM-binding protein YcdF (DUF218 family)
MKEYALGKRGLESSDIVADSKAMDTYSSLEALSELVVEKSLSRVVVVADYTHAPRVKNLIGKMGLASKVEVVASLWEDSGDERGYDYLKWEALGYLSSYLPRNLVNSFRGYS